MPIKICIFQKENDEYKCINCGFVLPKYIDFGVKRVCSNPSKLTKLKNVGKEVVKQGKNIVSGGKVQTTKEEVDRRLEICGECEYYKDNKCMLCGCNMPLKVRLEKSNCPIGKW